MGIGNRRGAARDLTVVACAGAFGVFATVFAVSVASMANDTTTPAAQLDGAERAEASTPGAQSQGERADRSDRAAPILYVNGVRIRQGLDGVRLKGVKFRAGPRGFGLDEVETLAGPHGIDPRSVERVDVIKGPKARELYGDEAAGGVIQVTLKKDADAPASEGESRP